MFTFIVYNNLQLFMVLQVDKYEPQIIFNRINKKNILEMEKLEPNERNVMVTLNKEQQNMEYMSACIKIMKDFVRDEWDGGINNKYKQFFVLSFLNLYKYIQNPENFHHMNDDGDIPWDLDNNKTDKAKRIIKKH